MATMTNCMHCGKLVDPNLDNCPYCGGFLRPKSSPSAAPAAEGRSQTCPNCRALVQSGDIICVACGTNLLTGQKIADTRTTAPTPSSGGPNWRIIAGAIAAVVVLAVAGFAIYLVTRDPVAEATRLASAGHTLQAIEVLRGHVEKNPNDVRARFELGRMYWLAENINEAASEFEWVALNSQDRRDAVLLAATALNLQPAPGNASRAVTLLESWTAGHPDDAQAWTLLAAAYGTNGNAPKQTEALKKATALEPDAADTKASLAIAAAQAQDFAAAEESLRSAVLLPDAAAAQATLGIVNHLTNNVAAAKENLAAAIANNAPAAAELHTQLALLHMQDGEFDEALAQLNAAVAFPGEHPAADYFRAVCYKALGLRPEATVALRAISDANTDFSADASLALADLQLNADEPDPATVSLDRAERQGASGAPLFTLRGRVLAAQGDVQGAQSYFDRATAADPNYAPAHLEKGLAYVKRNLAAEGIRSLERYLDLVNQTLPDARVNEIQTLVEQLRRAANSAV